MKIATNVFTAIARLIVDLIHTIHDILVERPYGTSPRTILRTPGTIIQEAIIAGAKLTAI